MRILHRQRIKKNNHYQDNAVTRIDLSMLLKQCLQSVIACYRFWGTFTQFEVSSNWQGNKSTDIQNRPHSGINISMVQSVKCTLTSLARRPQLGDFQGGSDSSPVSERPHTTIPVGLLCLCRQCWSAASVFHQLSTACSTSLPAQHLRPSGLFNCRTDSLELSPEFHLGPNHQFRLFQMAA